VTITLDRPDVDELGAAISVLAAWQREGTPMQLHPGDVGWLGRFGAPATAAALRTWSRDGRLVAIGMLDGPDLLRMTIDPDARPDGELADRLVEDLADPARGVLPAGSVSVEAPMDARLQDALLAAGWVPDEEWTPLRRDLSKPITPPSLRFEVIGADRAASRVEVHRAAFAGSTFSVEAWQVMAAGPAYADARCLVGFSPAGEAVAGVTVWSAGRGRPGLIEPMGAHRDHRGHGYGTAICVAAAVELQRLGSSSVVVATPTTNVGGVATYLAAGFEQFGASRDLRRPAA
jgi:GNAT superfamily N-acetyltransferase